MNKRNNGQPLELDMHVKLIMLRKQYHAMNARLQLQEQCNSSLQDENQRLRSALNASSNALAAASARKNEMLDAADELAEAWVKCVDVERFGKKRGPPFPADYACYHCAYRGLAEGRAEVACAWCIHNPFGKVFEKASALADARRERERRAVVVVEEGEEDETVT